MQPFARARSITGFFCFLIVGVLAVIDAVSLDYAFELGLAALMVGTGAVLLGVNAIESIASRITNGK